MGQLRALEQLGLMAGVDGISAVSGGSWASAIYMYADVPLDVLLGPPTDPGALDMAALRRTPPAMGKTAAEARNSLAINLAPPDRLWQFFVGRAFLAPFGLFDEREELLGRGAYLAGSGEQWLQVVALNPALARSKFVAPRPRRPKSYVMGCELLAPRGYVIAGNHTVNFQVGPGWAGVPFYPDGQPVAMESEDPRCAGGANRTLAACAPLCRWLGGGLLESFAMGSPTPPARWPGRRDALVQVPAPARPLTLADALGISSAAFANDVARLRPEGAFVPEADYWPVGGAASQAARRPPPASACGTGGMRYRLGDGGGQENTGVLAMLQRGARRLAWFVNTYVPMDDSFDWCAANATGANPDGLLDSSLYSLFGFGEADVSYDYSRNQVFAKDMLAPVVCQLQTRKREGQAAIARHTLKVVANPWWGIPGGNTVDSLVYYLDTSSAFEALLPADTRAELARGAAGAFANFPGYETEYQNPPELVRLTPAQVNLLAAQAEHAVLGDAELFRAVLAAEAGR